MTFLDKLLPNSGQSAPFGFGGAQQPDPYETLLGEYYNPKAAMWAAIGGGLQGLSTGLMTRDWNKAMEVSTQGIENYRNDAFRRYQMAQMIQANEDKKRTREKQEALTNKWTEFVTNNRDKFGEYADFAPYLDPGEGMKLLSGMQPDWRPASAEEKAAYGVAPNAPLVIGQGGEPKILGGGGTTINMPAMETSYDRELGGGLAKTMLQMQADKGNAQSALGTYDDMDAYLEQPGVYTGIGGPTVKALQQVGSALGISDPKIVANTEAFEAATNKAIKDEVGSLGAGVSEGDRRFVENANAGLTRTKTGNKMIIAMKRKIAQRKIQVADFAQEYAMSNGGRLDTGFYSALSQWAAANPIFTPEEQRAIMTASVQGRSAGGASQDGKGDQEAMPDLSTMSDEDLINALEGR